MTISSDKKTVAQGIFCVCTDESVSAAFDSAAGRTGGCTFFGTFQEYITLARKPHFSAALRGARSLVAAVDLDTDLQLALESVERLCQMFPKRIDVVGVSSFESSAVLRKAMRAGCAEFLIRPVQQDEIVASLTRFNEKSSHYEQEYGEGGRIIAFFGAKGGVGATTLAVHLAMCLRIRHEKRVLLIDHKHQLGHVTLYLGLKDTKYHFAELVKSASRLDKKLLEGFVLHHKSGVDVIGSPESAVSSQGSSRDDLDCIMDFLRREYDFILIDSSVGYEESKLSLIDQADEINLVSTPDVASLRDLARLVEDTALGEAGLSKLRLIVNRTTVNDSIRADQIKKIVHFPVFLSIANSYYEIMKAINAGEPLAPESESVFIKQINGWANGIAGKDMDQSSGSASGKRGLTALFRKALVAHG